MEQAPHDEAECAARCLMGDVSAFEPLVRRYERVVFAVAYRLVGNYEDARDVTQNTFVKAFEHLDRYDQQRKFFSWIYRIAVNECLNFRRARKQEEPLVDDFAVASGSFERLEAGEARARLDGALRSLSFEYREVIALRYFAELSYGEISEAAGVPEKTVKSRLFSARRRLATLLGASDGEGDGEA